MTTVKQIDKENIFESIPDCFAVININGHYQINALYAFREERFVFAKRHKSYIRLNADKTTSIGGHVVGIFSTVGHIFDVASLGQLTWKVETK